MSPVLRLCLSLALSGLSAAVYAVAPEGSPYSVPQPPFYGQVRPRTEFIGKNMYDTSSNKNLLNTHLRTRLGFVAATSPKTEIKVEIQDTRVMGSETPPPATAGNPASASVGNLKGVDLSQAYFAIEEGPFKTALGRQKMQLGAGRFLSTLEWHPYSRAFDGLSFNLTTESATLTGITYIVKDTNITTTKDHLLLSGLYYSHQVTPDIVAEAYTFYDKSRIPMAYGGWATANHDLLYYGQRVAGKVSMFTFEEEFIWQGGEATYKGKANTSAAFQFAGRVGLATPIVKANLGLDIMSGDKDSTDSDLNHYRANYYFAHAYYGWMDYFVANPKYGVMDYRFDVDIALLPNELGNPRVTIKPQYHYFVPQSAPSGLDDAYGQEFDLEIHLGLYPKSNIVLGAGMFLPGDNAYMLADAGLKKGQKDKPGMFLYFMPVFNF